MENKELMLYGETIAVYCDAHTKRKLYGQNDFWGSLKLGRICSNKSNLNSSCTNYIYVYGIKTTRTMFLIILTVYVNLEEVRSFETKDTVTP